ncbi:MAG TPA: protein kinase [Steroidobacteraceae bacterium]|nr:protein kinase [Steroidobacteraceae bacterium]
MTSPLRELTPEQFSRISQLLDESLELEPGERHAWLTALELRDSAAAALLRRLFASQGAGKGARFLSNPQQVAAALAAAISEDQALIERRFGPYRILSLLGHGGMGSVWLAERVDGMFTRQVALKLVHPILGPVLGERFSREREILASLSHAHIARLFDAGVAEDGQPYLALEYVAGSPLTRYCDEHCLGLAARLQLFRQVLSAVQYAHAHLIIHRDLKPSNILVTEDGQAQLLDFGIAKLLTEGSSTPETELTQLGGRALTPDYAAPEQILGAPITTAADVYSLGVIFYELLTGVRPYRLKRDSRGALEEAILQAEPLAPSRAGLDETVAAARDSTVRKLVRALVGDLDTIALKALKKTPAERYATANAFDEDIARFLRGDVVLAQPDSLVYRARKFVRRHRLGIATATLLVATLAGGLAATGYEARLAAAQRDQALQAQRQLLTQAAAARLNLGDSSGATGIMTAVLAQHAGDTPEALNVFEAARAADSAVLALAGHEATVNYASFSPDGTRVVTASKDHTARIWDAGSGLELQRLTGHTDTLTCAEFSPNGQSVITASVDGTARLWDAGTGRELRVFRAHGDHVNTATFSPDGRYVLTAADDKAAYLFDANSGALIHTFTGHSDRVASAEFSPDGRLIATASDDKTARIWDAATGRLLRVLSGHRNRAWFATFSPDGRRLVTASYDKTARVWDVATGRELLQLSGHRAPVASATYSPDGRYIATAGTDSIAIIWDANTGQLVRTLSGHTDRVWYAGFSPDSRRVVTSSDDLTARIWDIVPRGQLQVLSGHMAAVNAAHFSPDGREVVTASDDTTARIWDAATGRELQRFRGHTAPVLSAAFSPDGHYVVTASGDRTARIWEAASGREILQVKHADQATTAAFSHDGRRLVTASIDRTAHVWDAVTGQHLALLSGHTDLVGSATFSPDDTRVVTASSDQTARVWDSRSGRQLLVLRGHTGQVWSAEFSPDGRYILTAANDQTARLWDAHSGAKVARLEGLTDNVPTAEFSPDGRRVVLSLDDRTARIWDLASNRQVLALSGHLDLMEFASFAPDGRRIVTASDDGTARIWDTDAPPLAAQIAWAAAAEFDPLSRTQRDALGLPQPSDERAPATVESTCDKLAGAPYDPDRLAIGVSAGQIDSEPAIAACTPGPGVARSERERYEYGRALAAGNRRVAARAELEQAVAGGYRAAGVDLARLLTTAPSAPADGTRAISLLEHAWSQNVTIAAFELGSLYERGISMGSTNDAQAWRWYQRGADIFEPDALARFGQREQQAAQAASDRQVRRRHQLAAFEFYASAADRARREGWPDQAWRIWRWQRATLARLLALEGGTPDAAAAYERTLGR